MDAYQRENYEIAVEIDQSHATDEECSISYPATNVIRGMIRELLTLPEFTLTKIAADIGTSSATIRRVLQGNTLQPSVRTFDKIIRLYCSVCHRLYQYQLEVESDKTELENY